MELGVGWLGPLLGLHQIEIQVSALAVVSSDAQSPPSSFSLLVEFSFL